METRRLSGEIDGPTEEVVREYWGRLLQDPGQYQIENPAVAEWTKEVQGQGESQTDDEPLGDEIFTTVMKKGKNWKAAGRDGISAYWWKAFPQASQSLWQIIKKMIIGKKILEWLVKGRTVLIPKEGCEGKPDQYRPITVLNNAYKLFTGVLTEVLKSHVMENDILPIEQKALRKGSCA